MARMTVPESRDPDRHGTPELALATRTFCRGVLHAIGMFDPAVTDGAKRRQKTRQSTAPGSASARPAWQPCSRPNIAVPAFFWFAGITALPLAFIGAAVLFLPLFVFLPKIIRYAMKADTDAVLEAFGKNEQTRKVFWALFIATAGLVLAEVVDPVTAQAILAAITGT